MGSRDVEGPATIEGLAGKIRDIVKCCEVSYRARKDFANFAKLCTCMDTIEDAELAIGAFQVDPHDDRVGHNYLMIYGLFQAYVIQQDAALNLCSALRKALGGGFAYKLHDYPGLKGVRALRVEIAGHPTLKGREGTGTASYHSLSRAQIGSNSLTLMSEYMEGEKREFRRVYFRETTEKQAKGIAAILQAALGELQEWQNAEKAKYAESKLAFLFPEGYGNLFVEMQASALGKSPHSVGASSVDAICEIMDKYAAELERRELSVEAYPGVQEAYQDLQHPVSALRAFFTQEPACADEVAMKRAYVMSRFAEERITELHDMAREIDTAYAINATDECGSLRVDMAAPGITVAELEQDVTVGAEGEDAPGDIPVDPTLASRFRALQYCVAKVCEGTYPETRQVFARLNLESVKEELDLILSVMRKHGLLEEEKPSIVGDTMFVLSMLSDFYDGTGAVSAPDASVYAWYLGRLVNEVQAVAVRTGLVTDRVL